MEPKEGVYISPAYETVVEHADYIECGSGPEEVRARKYDNPNWLRNRAANCIALAEWIENTEKRRVDEAYALGVRRDELAKVGWGSTLTFGDMHDDAKRMIDRIIKLEQAS